MFCSKCGAQNNDGSAFCNKCGSRLAVIENDGNIPESTYQRPVYVQNIGFIKGEAEEKLKKQDVLTCFFISEGLDIVFLLAILFSRFKFIVDLMHFESLYYTELRESVAATAFDNLSSWVGIELVIMIILLIINFVKLRNSCIKRNFSGLKKSVISGEIFGIVTFLAVWILFPVSISADTKGKVTMSLLYFVVFSVLLAAKIAFIVLYSSASKAEEKYVMLSSGWKCLKCGRTNNNNSLFCQCGQKKSSADNALSKLTSSMKDSDNGMWKCTNCGDLNPKSSSICSGCGKYK